MVNLTSPTNASIADAQGVGTITNDDQVTNRPPHCEAVPSIAEIWPPNHKMVEITILGVTDPDDDPVTITITGITQDEPLNTYGDGNFEPDGAGVGTPIAQVRAERSGTPKVPGNGRVYVISFTASDGNGGTCEGSVSVCVPHDQRPGHVCIDDGQQYDSTGGTPPLASKNGKGKKAKVLLAKVGEEAPAVPDAFGLEQSYPNPFNPSTTIRYALPEAANVRLTVYSILGQEVKTLVNAPQAAGFYSMHWDGRDALGRQVSTGVYLYRLEAGANVAVRKMILAK